MINKALLFIQQSLNEHLQNVSDENGNRILLRNVVGRDGTSSSETENKIIFFLLNVDEESTLKNNFNRSPDVAGNFKESNSTVHLNLHLLFCANFIDDNYPEGLAYLSSIIQYFQQNPTVRPVAPGDPLHNSKLLFEMQKLDYNQLSNIWSAVGSKLLPSVLYKVRLLAFKDSSIGAPIPSIKQPQNKN